jgi:hypothetical protein
MYTYGFRDGLHMYAYMHGSYAIMYVDTYEHMPYVLVQIYMSSIMANDDRERVD